MPANAPLLFLVAFVVFLALAIPILKIKFQRSRTIADPFETGPRFRQEKHFLSPGELEFFHALAIAIGKNHAICPKVRISDLITAQRRHRNTIDRKHVDFVLCDPRTMTPLLVLELDDKSHDRPDRIKRDALVDAAFTSAGLPILHIPASARYAPTNLAAQILAIIARSPEPAHQPPDPIPAKQFPGASNR